MKINLSFQPNFFLVVLGDVIITNSYIINFIILSGKMFMKLKGWTAKRNNDTTNYLKHWEKFIVAENW